MARTTAPPAPSNPYTHGRTWIAGGPSKEPGVLLAVLLAITFISPPGIDAAPKPVNAARPRLLLTAADKARLLAKKNANDPSWVTLKARADALATYPIYPYKFATWETTPPNTIN